MGIGLRQRLPGCLLRESLLGPLGTAYSMPSSRSTEALYLGGSDVKT